MSYAFVKKQWTEAWLLPATNGLKIHLKNYKIFRHKLLSLEGRKNEKRRAKMYRL